MSSKFYLRRLHVKTYNFFFAFFPPFRITEKSSENSMDSKNLAICWWPTLLQFEFTNMDLFEQKRPHLMNFVQIMIDSYTDLFPFNADSEDNLATLSCSADELSSL